MDKTVTVKADILNGENEFSNPIPSLVSQNNRQPGLYKIRIDKNEQQRKRTSYRKLTCGS